MEFEKLKSVLKDFQSAASRLAQVLKMKATQVNMDATIQRFEFTFELGWKLMKTVADYQGKGEDAKNPRSAIRYVATQGLVSHPELWFEFLEKRNTASHLYSQEAAKNVYQAIKKFPPLCQELAKNVENFVVEN